MSDCYRPHNGPSEPPRPPEGRAPASMPPDPFGPADAPSVMIMSEFHGLRRADASLVEAALIVAAHVVINGLAAQAQNRPPDHGLS